MENRERFLGRASTPNQLFILLFFWLCVCVCMHMYVDLNNSMFIMQKILKEASTWKSDY